MQDSIRRNDNASLVEFAFGTIASFCCGERLFERSNHNLQLMDSSCLKIRRTSLLGPAIAWAIGTHDETGFAAKIKINLAMALPAHLDCGWLYIGRLQLADRNLGWIISSHSRSGFLQYRERSVIV